MKKDIFDDNKENFDTLQDLHFLTNMVSTMFLLGILCAFIGFAILVIGIMFPDVQVGWWAATCILIGGLIICAVCYVLLGWINERKELMYDKLGKIIARSVLEKYKKEGKIIDVKEIDPSE